METKYFHRGFIVYPEIGRVVNKRTGREIAAGKSRIIYRTKNGRRSSIKKMRLVYEAVHGPLKNGVIIEAIDGDESNAVIKNIRIIEKKEYFKDHDWSMKTVITEEEVEKIKEDYGSGEYSYSTLARKYKCSRSTIYKVLRGEYFYDKKKNKDCSAGRNAHCDEFDNGVREEADYG